MRVNDEKVKKIFIGGLPPDATEGSPASPEMLEDYFGKYGVIKTCRIIYKHDSQVSRGFGFIIFQHKESAEAVIDHRNDHFINGKWVDCKSAILRQEMKQPAPQSDRKQKPQKRANPRSGHHQANTYAHQQAPHYPSTASQYHSHNRQQASQSYQYTSTSQHYHRSHYKNDSHQPSPPHHQAQTSDRYQQQFDHGQRAYLPDSHSGSGYNYSEPKKASSGEQKKSNSSQTTKKKENSSNFEKNDTALPQAAPLQSGSLLVPGLASSASRRLPQAGGASPKKIPLPVNEIPEYPDEYHGPFNGNFLPSNPTLPIAHNYIPLPIGDSPINFRSNFQVFQAAHGADRYGEFGGFFTPQAQTYGQQVYQGTQKTAKGKLQDRDFLTPTYKPQETGFSSYFEKVVGSRKPMNDEEYEDEM